MITAVVRYKLPPSIDAAACHEHYASIAPGFREVPGLISKHFICGDHGIAGGIYQWETREKAEDFYSGPWRDGIIQRYGVEPGIEYFTVFGITDNERQDVQILDV